MYYPLLRGKQFELLAVRETLGKHVSKDLVIPIIEPVNANPRDIFKCAIELEKVDAGFFLIVNPQVGDLANNYKTLDLLIDQLIEKNNHLKFAFWIGDNANVQQVESFLDEYSNFDTGLIHASRSIDPVKLSGFVSEFDSLDVNFFLSGKIHPRYIGYFDQSKKVLIEDPFNRKSRNADYPDDEFFSSAVFNYSSNGFAGFSDFSTIGNAYSASGGPAITSALHFTYEKKPQVDEIWIRHFLSDYREHAGEDASTLVS